MATVRERLAEIAPAMLASLEQFAGGRKECPMCGGSKVRHFVKGTTRPCRRCGGGGTVQLDPDLAIKVSQYLLDQAIGKARQDVQLSSSGPIELVVRYADK